MFDMKMSCSSLVHVVVFCVCLFVCLFVCCFLFPFFFIDNKTMLLEITFNLKDGTESADGKTSFHKYFFLVIFVDISVVLSSRNRGVNSRKPVQVFLIHVWLLLSISETIATLVNCTCKSFIQMIQVKLQPAVPS